MANIVFRIPQKLYILSDFTKETLDKIMPLGLVRNVQYREPVFDSEFVQQPSTIDGRYVPPTNTTKNYSKTITEE